MSKLKEKCQNPKIRTLIIEDCVILVDSEVSHKKGVTGIMIKAGYKTFKAIKPTIVKDAVNRLLDDFAVKLDNQYKNYTEAVPGQSTPFEQWAKSKDQEIANDLLGVTDDIMARSQKNTIKKIYSGLRKTAQGNVAQAVPAVARLVVKYLD